MVVGTSTKLACICASYKSGAGNPAVADEDRIPSDVVICTRQGKCFSEKCAPDDDRAFSKIAALIRDYSANMTA